MNKVYHHKPMSRDEYLGRVDESGKVYKNVAGPKKPDTYIGRVDLHTGKVFDASTVPEELVGRVDTDTGKVFRSKFGPDEYLGRVAEDGKLSHHKPLARDDYMGKVTDMSSYAHGGAAFLLLVYPLFEDRREAESISGEETD